MQQRWKARIQLCSVMLAALLLCLLIASPDGWQATQSEDPPPLMSSSAPSSADPSLTSVGTVPVYSSSVFDEMLALPSSVNAMAQYYRSNIDASSTNMMLRPKAYRQMSCSTLMEQHESEYKKVSERVNFNHAPLYKMPWYYHDPHPLCGRYMLQHLLDGWGRQYSPPDTLFRLRLLAPKNDADHIEAYVGEENTDVLVEHCGLCAKSKSCTRDVLLHARVVSEDSIIHADVLPMTEAEGSSVVHVVRFTPRVSGQYVLEIKLVHVNGSSNNASDPRSLGVIGIRASDHNRKSFKYNLVCDVQRHIYGSPIQVIVKKRSAATYKTAPLCSYDNHNQESGHWVRFTPTTCAHSDSPYCWGNPAWLSDACAFNDQMLWVPDGCKYKFYTPPTGPHQSCLKRQRRGFLLLVGDSVTREYAMNCNQFDLRKANLVCLFNNIALEGQHYSLSYAKDVAKVILASVKSNKAAVFATNLGIHHMIGPCSTKDWIQYVDTFVHIWRAENLTILHEGGNDQWLLEKAVWVGPPSIHYARNGMGFQRAVLWDRLAWERLRRLGFRRLNAIAPTYTRIESTWDGLHYAAAKGKVQSPWRNRNAAVLPWNGGVANMLFTILLNVICDPQ